MTKTRIIILLILILFLIFFPRKIKADSEVEIKPQLVAQVQVVAEPEPYITNQFEAIEYIKKTFPDAPVMLRIAQAESRYCTNNVNPYSSARGCFQILKGTWLDYKCVGDVMDPVDNINCARKIYDRSGTIPWNASKHNWGQAT